MAMETLKKTVSDNSSIASRGNHEATGLDLISRVLTSASPRDTIISESSKDATLKSSHNQETPTKAWKRPWPLLSPASPSLLSARAGELEGQELQPSPAKGVSIVLRAAFVTATNSSNSIIFNFVSSGRNEAQST